MIKASIKGRDGQQGLLVIGLSFGNLDKFRAAPGDTHIKIDGREMGLPVDVTIFSGETEAHLAAVIQDLIGPTTKVTTDPRLKK